MSNKAATELGSTRDSEYMAVTEVMALADDAMTQNAPDALLVISLSGKFETAIVGGALSAEAIERMVALLEELKRRAAVEEHGDKVLHVWR
ncbi:MAG: hypothetical protein ACOH2R_08460 [Pseudomonas sp.]